jgi:hypothetical protein
VFFVRENVTLNFKKNTKIKEKTIIIISMVNILIRYVRVGARKILGLKFVHGVQDEAIQKALIL